MSDSTDLCDIDGLVRCETHDRNALGELVSEMTHTVYRHDDVYGTYCTVHAHVECPPSEVFDYMADPRNLEEWTYSVRRLRSTDKPDVLVGVDAGDTPIFVRTVHHRAALTVDYHCAWDQGDHLWMVYLNRIVPAELVLDRPGSVVIWTNCRHPYYARNPHPELAPPSRAEWVGDWWPLFYAGHTLELHNLKRIVEYRYAHGHFGPKRGAP